MLLNILISALASFGACNTAGPARPPVKTKAMMVRPAALELAGLMVRAANNAYAALAPATDVDELADILWDLAVEPEVIRVMGVASSVFAGMDLAGLSGQVEEDRTPVAPLFKRMLESLARLEATLGPMTADASLDGPAIEAAIGQLPALVGSAFTPAAERRFLSALLRAHAVVIGLAGADAHEDEALGARLVEALASICDDLDGAVTQLLDPDRLDRKAAQAAQAAVEAAAAKTLRTGQEVQVLGS